MDSTRRLERDREAEKPLDFDGGDAVRLIGEPHRMVKPFGRLFNEMLPDDRTVLVDYVTRYNNGVVRYATTDGEVTVHIRGIDPPPGQLIIRTDYQGGLKSWT